MSWIRFFSYRLVVRGVAHVLVALPPEEARRPRTPSRPGSTCRGPRARLLSGGDVAVVLAPGVPSFGPRPARRVALGVLRRATVAGLRLPAVLIGLAAGGQEVPAQAAVADATLENHDRRVRHVAQVVADSRSRGRCCPEMVIQSFVCDLWPGCCRSTSPARCARPCARSTRRNRRSGRGTCRPWLIRLQRSPAFRTRACSTAPTGCRPGPVLLMSASSPSGSGRTSGRSLTPGRPRGRRLPGRRSP